MNDPFNDLFTHADSFSDLLDEGPGVEPGDSERFLNELKSELAESLKIVNALTASEVDAEFTEKSDADDDDSAAVSPLVF